MFSSHFLYQYLISVFEIEHLKCLLSQHAVTNNMQFPNLKM